jgi:hypothetical protein
MSTPPRKVNNLNTPPRINPPRRVSDRNDTPPVMGNPRAPPPSPASPMTPMTAPRVATPIITPPIITPPVRGTRSPPIPRVRRNPMNIGTPRVPRASVNLEQEFAREEAVAANPPSQRSPDARIRRRNATTRPPSPPRKRRNP